jgi:hypothetical protein
MGQAVQVEKPGRTDVEFLVYSFSGPEPWSWVDAGFAVLDRNCNCAAKPGSRREESFLGKGRCSIDKHLRFTWRPAMTAGAAIERRLRATQTVEGAGEVENRLPTASGDASSRQRPRSAQQKI